jgi:hypothetical protein
MDGFMAGRRDVVLAGDRRGGDGFAGRCVLETVQEIMADAEPEGAVLRMKGNRMPA